MKQAQTDQVSSPSTPETAPQSLELRHLRYFVALAETGNFTRAAEALFISQPTLSQQIRRLEVIVGAPLLRRRREGLSLTAAGTVLLAASRDVLAVMNAGVGRTRQAAGLGHPRLRVVVPPRVPEALAVQMALRLRSVAEAADVDVVWMEAPLDAEFSLIRQRRADAGLAWLTAGPEKVPAPLDAMSLGEFEPEVWIPAWHAAARRGSMSLDELAGMEVIHGPRQAEAATYDAWTRVLRSVDPCFAFTDPPVRHSLPVALAFAAIGGRPAAVLTGPRTIAGTWSGPARPARQAATQDMIRVSLENRPLTATGALVWSGDLPRSLQQILFDTADGICLPAPAQSAGHAPLSALPVSAALPAGAESASPAASGPPTPSGNGTRHRCRRFDPVYRGSSHSRGRVDR